MVSDVTGRLGGKLGKWILGILVTVAVAPVLGSYAGLVHPLGDSLAVFRLEFAGLVLLMGLVAFLVRFRRLAAIAGVVALVAGGPILWMMRSAPVEGPYSLYQKNLLFANQTPLEAVEDILALGPDVVTLQEVTEAHASVMARLREAYPISVVCPFARVGGVAVLSRWPMAEGGVVCDPTARRGYVAVQVQSPAGPLWIVSVHLHWPWPYRQAGQVEQMADELVRLEGPVIMAGDFNMVPWSHALRQLAGATETKTLGPLMLTIERPESPLLRLRIDHVYVPVEWSGGVDRRPRLGSDHFGLFARFGP